MLEPRYYQEEAIIGIFNYFNENSGNPVVALPTGTGKALVQAEFMRRALLYYPQTRILCLTHVKELVAQNHAELLEQWPTAPAGIFSAGLRRKDTHLPITFCGIASVHKCLEYFGFIHLVLIDECHMISDKGSTMYLKAIEELKLRNPLLKVVGFTATPFRLGMGLITEGKLFTDICVDYCSLDKFNELVDAGFISPLIPKRTGIELDVSGVGISQGEFNSDELQAAVDKENITRGALEEAQRLAIGRKRWLVFCTGTDHADHARDMLNEMGIPAVSVHSKLIGGDAERDRNISWFRGPIVSETDVRAMVGVGVFTTGFNYKPVDCILVLRPTMSTGLWVQLLGRGTRPSPETGKKNCLVLDFAANTRRLGPINDPVIPRRKGKKQAIGAPYKICPSCDTYCHTRVRYCPSCQYEFPETFKAEVNAATDELIVKKRVQREEPSSKQSTVSEHVVDRVEYAKHFSKDSSKPPSLRVTFYSGSKTFNEWLCLEHQGFALHRARQQWTLMGGNSYIDGRPITVDDALSLVNDLKPPTKIRVLHTADSKWPEIVGYEFDTPGIEQPEPTVFDDGADNAHIHEDDIPF